MEGRAARKKASVAGPEGRREGSATVVAGFLRVLQDFGRDEEEDDESPASRSRRV
jgi:hypothetical protein